MTEPKRQLLADYVGPGRVEILRGDTITPQPIDWIWPNWLAGGKFHLIAGQAGTGKTTIALALAAIISTGGRFPDGFPAVLGDILIWSGEDDIKDSILPRFLANGGDRTRVYFVKGGRDENGNVRQFEPSTDMPELAETARRILDLRLLILDPVVTAVPGDSHKNAEVRRGLQPVVDLASSVGAAVLGITHFTKGTTGRDPIERVTGSLAFGALARLVMGTAKGAEATDPRRLVRAKSNIGPDGDGFEYELVQVHIDHFKDITGQRVIWGEALEGSARELLAEVEGTGQERPNPELERAVERLDQLLGHGPLSVTDVKQQANLAGLSWKTVNRAKRVLGIKSRKTSLDGGWVWVLPSAEGGHEGGEDGHPDVMATFEDGHSDEVAAFGEGDHHRPDTSDREVF